MEVDAQSPIRFFFFPLETFHVKISKGVMIHMFLLKLNFYPTIFYQERISGGFAFEFHWVSSPIKMHFHIL